MNLIPSPPIIGFVAFSGAGKTTLLIQILPILRARGLSIGVIKHAHHHFDIDQPGKDSYVLREAGAVPILIASSRRWAMVVDHAQDDEPKLSDCVKQITATTHPDLILVEGFKHERHPKIEVHRPALGHKLLCTGDTSIIALATDQPNITPPGVIELDLNKIDKIANFVEAHYRNNMIDTVTHPPS